MDTEFDLFLGDISHAFLGRDLALWRSRLLLPFSLITRDKPIILATEDAVHRNFQFYLKAIEALGLDLIHRAPVSLEQCPDGTWLGTFQTRLLRAEAFATRPYISTALLQPVDGRFRMSSMLNARGHSEWTGIDEAFI